MLALKLLIVPFFLGVITLAGRRWGPRVAGRLAGFPVIAGPVLLFLAIERGPDFASQAASASLSAMAGTVSFNVAYSWACLHASWPLALPAALLAWFVPVLLTSLLPSSPLVFGPIALVALLIGPRLFPATAALLPQRPLPNSELFLRMGAGALLTLVVTLGAGAFGPTWSGLLVLLPVLGTALAVFSHKTNGPPYVVALLRAMIGGLYALAVFCFSIAILLPGHGIAPSFGAALALAIAAQLIASLFAAPSPEPLAAGQQGR